MHQLILHEGYVSLKEVISDQSAGFRAARMEYAPNMIHQLAEHHMNKNILAYIYKTRKHSKTDDIWFVQLSIREFTKNTNPIKVEELKCLMFLTMTKLEQPYYTRG